MLKNKISFALVKKVVLDRSGNGMESFGKDRSCEIKNNLLPASPTPTPTPTSTSEMDIFDRLKRKQKHLRYLQTYSLTCLLCVAVSVTRFGEISPLWKNCKSLWLFCEGITLYSETF